MSAVAAFNTAARHGVGTVPQLPVQNPAQDACYCTEGGTPQNPGAKFSRGCGKKTAWGDAGVHMVGHIHQHFNTRLAARSLGARKPIKCAFRPIVIRQVHFDT